MGRRFLIAGTGAAVGKTTVGCALGFAFRARGMRVGVMKPIETGCAEAGGELEPADARALTLAASSQIGFELICPYRYRSRLAPIEAARADHLPPPKVDEILRCFHEIAAQSDAVLVESIGGLGTPIAQASDFADLASILGLEVIMIVGNRLGCVDDAASALAYAGSRRLAIAGAILCDVEPAGSVVADANETALIRLAAAPFLGRMRYREPLAKAIVEALI